MIHVAIVGFGSIGRRHLANIRALEPGARITVVRHRSEDTNVPPGADRVVHDLQAALADAPDVAFVCGPTALHADASVALARGGVHLFVEKPLALDSAGAWRIVEAAGASGRVLVVGYTLRFSESLRTLHAAACDGRIGRVMSGRAEAGQYLPDWRPAIDYRGTNSARAELGGGVVLELSHEIDYMRWLLGEVDAIDAWVGRLSDLEIDAADTADLLLSCVGNRRGNIHLSMTQRNAVRRCQLVGTDGTLEWDGIAGATRWFRPESGWTTLVAADSQERNAMYLAQAAHVFACVRGEAAPLVDGRAGARIVELAEAALRAAREERRIAV